MLGLSFDKLIIIAFIAVALVGPKRLPSYAAQLARWAKVARDLANGAKTRVAAELGPEFEEVDWKKFDPRQYDPRRIIIDALSADDGAPAAARPAAAVRKPSPHDAIGSLDSNHSDPDDLADALIEPESDVPSLGGPPRSAVPRRRHPSLAVPPRPESSGSPAHLDGSVSEHETSIEEPAAVLTKPTATVAEFKET